MHPLRLKRIRFSKEADNWLRVLKSRTGITPNLICRLGFCLSLEEPRLPDPAKFPEDSQREINRYTLLGEYDDLFVALLKQRIAREPQRQLTSDVLDAQFRAHMNRGVILLAGRLKHIGDLHHLIAEASTSADDPQA